MNIRKILIYRLGSLGDTVVALPCIHLIARAFPDAERRVLTNSPVNGKAVSVEDVIGGSGLVNGYFKYPLGTRSPRKLWILAREIRRWAPELLVYLAEPRGKFSVYRDALFFSSCGIRKMVGMPYSAKLWKHKRLYEEGRFESEASRLARCVKELGDAFVERPESWDLRLNEAERSAAAELLPKGMPPFISVSVGAKVGVKDWGEGNWSDLFSRVSDQFPGLGLVMIGSEDEGRKYEYVAAGWKGPKRNFCGLTSPRVSASMLEKSILFVGHDSGPMHLAAACGVPCVAVFSARNEPGVWFPFGSGHRVIYHRTDCHGCRLEKCLEYKKKCIASITVEEVLDAVCGSLRPWAHG